MTLTLTAAELAELTKRERPAAQARILRALGIPFRAHPDGSLLVLRSAAEAALGTELPAGKMPAGKPEYEVDVEGIRQHGKTPATH